MKEARFWEASAQGKVHCRLCPHQCRIAPGAGGRCNVRHNRDGVLYASNYGVISGLALDPMEKKPLYHFYPGRLVLSVGSAATRPAFVRIGASELCCHHPHCPGAG